MSQFIENELKRLNGDFTSKTGRPFTHFYCPILYRDEKAELCRAHVINHAFDDSKSVCTVQRADVDSFYGSQFEADFLDITHFSGTSAFKMLTTPHLSRRFNTTFLHNNKPIPHFYPSGEVPGNFSIVQVSDSDVNLPLGLKIHPTEIIAAANGKWEVEISRDLRLPVLVSAIKAAHLSLFKLLGYRYVFTNSSHFIGRMILGDFFLQNHQTPKREITSKAIPFFKDFVHMVRPLTSTTFDAKGTITDRMMFMCMGASGKPWAFIVLVNTGEHMYGVMIPTLQHIDQVEAFLGFMDNSNSSIQVSTCRFDEDKWSISQETMTMTWPKDGALLS